MKFLCIMKKIYSNKLVKCLIIFSILIFIIIIYLKFLFEVQKQDIYDNKNSLDWMNNKEHPVSQDDPALVKENFIHGMNNEPYKVSDRNDQSFGQLDALIRILKKLKTGFFVELGANDGEWGSNTLYLERVLGWNGLLIEGSPSTYEKLRQKNRKAWHSNAAVSTISSPMKATFYENSQNSLLGGLTYRFYHGINKPTEVQCIPFYTLLLAINQTVVDFLSLDLEGSELDVLRTIPFHKLTINSLAVEVINGKEGPEPVKELMTKNGFILIAVVTDLGDLIFVRSQFLKDIENQSL